MTATLGAAWGWLVAGILLGIPTYGVFCELRNWWREHQAAQLRSGRAQIILAAQQAAWRPVLEGLRRGEFLPLPPSAFDPVWEKALPDKPMRYSTLDELLGPTVDEP